MFFQFESADREDDLWATTSPQSEEAPFRLFAAPVPPASQAEPAFMSQDSDDDSRYIAFDRSPPPSPSPPPPRPTTAVERQAAAQDSLDGIHYTREKFPSDAISYLAATFSREPVQVEEDEQVIILDEVSEFALRVRVVRTGAVGVLPAWNVEGALERLARLNMAFNEVATCPKEIVRRDRDVALSSLASHMHVHDRCVSEPRLRAPASSSSSPFTPSGSDDRSDEDNDNDNDNDMDTDFPDTPTTPPDLHVPHPSHSHAHAHPQKHRKSVEFLMSPRRTIFRYPPPPADEDGEDDEPESIWSDSGSDSEANDKGEDADADEQWWWNGWEESHDVVFPAALHDGLDDSDARSVGGSLRHDPHVQRRRTVVVT